MLAGVIFKGVGDHKPYPDHGLSQRQWGELDQTHEDGAVSGEHHGSRRSDSQADVASGGLGLL